MSFTQTTVTTKLTMLETFRLLEKLDISFTFDNYVKVSGFDATDVALSFERNLAKVGRVLDVTGINYLIGLPVYEINNLRSMGLLAEVKVFSPNQVLRITNVDNWTDFTLSDVETARVDYVNSHPGATIPAATTGSLGGTYIEWVLGTTTINQTLYNHLKAFLGQFVTIYDDAVMTEEKWIKGPNGQI